MGTNRGIRIGLFLAVVAASTGCLKTSKTVNEAVLASGSAGTGSSGSSGGSGSTGTPTPPPPEPLSSCAAAQLVYDSISLPAGETFSDIVTLASGTLIASGQGLGYQGVQYSWLVYRSTDDGKTWAIVDKRFPTGLNAAAGQIAVDSAGRIFVLGDLGLVAGDTSFVGQIRMSTDDGLTWTTIDQSGTGESYYGIAAGNGALYISGTDSSTATTKLILKKLTAPNFVASRVGSYTENGSGFRFAAGPSGELLGAVIDYNPTTPVEFFRRSTDGVNWTDLSVNNCQLRPTHAGPLYRFGANNLVEKSSDFGQTWNQAPNAFPSTFNFPSEINTSSSGKTVAIVGTAGNDSTSYIRWSPDSGATWATLGPSQPAYLYGLTFTAKGALLTGGSQSANYMNGFLLRVHCPGV
jgi:photosystem II stability/assembly factor-like uncharacterized protein